MTIPTAVESAPGAVADAAGRYNDLQRGARAARAAQRTLERQLHEAERHDVRAAGEATATGKKSPERTAPGIKAKLEQAIHDADVAASAAMAGQRLFGEAVTQEAGAWLVELDQAHADATADLRTALDAVATAAEAISHARAARGWLEATVDQFGDRGNGRIITSVPAVATPRVAIGASTWDYATVVAALDAWGQVDRPSPLADAVCALPDCNGIVKRTTEADTYCSRRCANAADAWALYRAELKAAG